MLHKHMLGKAIFVAISIIVVIIGLVSFVGISKMSERDLRVVDSEIQIENHNHAVTDFADCSKGHDIDHYQPFMDVFDHLDAYAKFHSTYKADPAAHRYLLYRCSDYGLGNRLNGIVSALVLSILTDRILILSWVADGGCMAKFDELFESPLDLSPDSLQLSIDTAENSEELGKLRQLLYGCLDSDVLLHIHDMINDIGPKLGCDDLDEVFPQKFVSVASYTTFLPLLTMNTNYQDHALLSSLRDSDHAYGLLLRWLCRPVPQIQQQIDMFVHKWDERPAVGVHIRHIAEMSYTLRTNSQISKSFACANGLTHVLSREWQRKCSKDITPAIFLATDNPEIREIATTKLTGDVYYQNTSLFRNTVEGIQSAVADMWILGYTDDFVGSQFSSFSSAASALRLKRPPFQVPRDGVCYQLLTSEPHMNAFVNTDFLEKLPCQKQMSLDHVNSLDGSLVHDTKPHCPESEKQTPTSTPSHSPIVPCEDGSIDQVTSGCTLRASNEQLANEYLHKFTDVQIESAKQAVSDHTSVFNIKSFMVNRDITSPDDVLCVTDSNWQYADMMMNCLIGFRRAGCKHIAVVAYEESLRDFLQEIGITAFFNQTFMDEGQQLLDNTPGCPDYLFGPMWLRLRMVTDLVIGGIPFILADSDTYIMKDQREKFLEYEMVMGYGELTHPYVEKPPEDHYIGGYWMPYVKNSSGQQTLNQVAYKPSPPLQSLIYDFYWKGLRNNICQEGFGQIQLQEILYNHAKMRCEFEPGTQDTVMIGTTPNTVGKYAGIRMWASSQVVWPMDDIEFEDTYLFHALGAGPTPEIRIEYYKRHGMWFLRSDWKDVPRTGDMFAYIDEIVNTTVPIPKFSVKRPPYWMNMTRNDL